MISRSLHVPGSPSSALTTRYRGVDPLSHPGGFMNDCVNQCQLRPLGERSHNVLHTHFRPDGNPAPPRPRRPEVLISPIICFLKVSTQHSTNTSCGQQQSAYPVMPLQEDLLGLIPIPILHSRLKVSTMIAVEILENPILILQISIGSVRCRRFAGGSQVTTRLLAITSDSRGAGKTRRHCRSNRTAMRAPC